MSIVDRIAQEEGFSAKPYKCPAGKQTIGFGHNLDAAPLIPDVAANLRVNGYVTPAGARRQLEHDIKGAVKVAQRLFVGFDDLPMEKQEALIDMAFNLGEGTLSRFARLRNAIAIKDFEEAAREIKNSKYFEQVPNRAQRNIDLILT